jgi:hypothetical protein
MTWRGLRATSSSTAPSKRSSTVRGHEKVPTSGQVEVPVFGQLKSPLLGVSYPGRAALCGDGDGVSQITGHRTGGLL